MALRVCHKIVALVHVLYEEVGNVIAAHVGLNYERTHLERLDGAGLSSSVLHTIVGGEQHPLVLADSWEPCVVVGVRLRIFSMFLVLDFFSVERPHNFGTRQRSVQTCRKLLRPLCRFPTRLLP